MTLSKLRVNKTGYWGFPDFSEHYVDMHNPKKLKGLAAPYFIRLYALFAC
jgi:hypothetical protein